jgi:hypothetical protein
MNNDPNDMESESYDFRQSEVVYQSEYEFAKEGYGAEDDEGISEEDNILKGSIIHMESKSNRMPEHKDEAFDEDDEDED